MKILDQKTRDHFKPSLDKFNPLIGVRNKIYGVDKSGETRLIRECNSDVTDFTTYKGKTYFSTEAGIVIGLEETEPEIERDTQVLALTSDDQGLLDGTAEGTINRTKEDEEWRRRDGAVNALEYFAPGSCEDKHVYDGGSYPEINDTTVNETVTPREKETYDLEGLNGTLYDSGASANVRSTKDDSVLVTRPNHVLAIMSDGENLMDAGKYPPHSTTVVYNSEDSFSDSNSLYEFEDSITAMEFEDVRLMKEAPLDHERYREAA